MTPIRAAIVDDEELARTYLRELLADHPEVEIVAGLEEGVVSTEDFFECPGRIHVGRSSLRCEGIHGPIAMHEAVVKSCNVYFYRLASRLGYRITERFVHHFMGKIFDNPTAVFTREILRPAREQPLQAPSASWRLMIHSTHSLIALPRPGRSFLGT